MGERLRTLHANQLLANPGPNAVNRQRLERVKFRHDGVFRAAGITAEQTPAAARIASVVHAVAATLYGDAAAVRMQAA